MAQGRGGAARRHRGRRHRHAEPPPRPGGPRLSRRRHPRHLRQAADDDAGGGPRPRRPCAPRRPALRPHPQLHRLPHGAAGPRHGARRASSARSASCRSNMPQDWLAGPLEDDRAEAGRVAHRSGTLRRRRLPRRHRHPRLQPRRLRHRPRRRGDLRRAHDLRARAAGSTTTCRSCCAIAAARAAASGPARWRAARRTRSACASTAPQGGLEWRQTDANELVYSPLGEARRILTRNGAGANEASRARVARALRPPGRLPRSLRQPLH